MEGCDFLSDCRYVTVKRVVSGSVVVSTLRGSVIFSGTVQEESGLFGPSMPDASSGKTKRVVIPLQTISEVYHMR